MIAESARWGDAQRNTPFTLTNWQDAVESTRSWLATRHDDVLDQLRGQDWYPDLNPPEFNVNGQPKHGGDDIEPGPDRPIGIRFVSFTRRSWSGNPSGGTWMMARTREPLGASRITMIRNGAAGQLSWGLATAARRLSSKWDPTNNRNVTTYFRKDFALERRSKPNLKQV